MSKLIHILGALSTICCDTNRSISLAVVQRIELVSESIDNTAPSVFGT